MNHSIPVFVLVSLLTACGGGGGDGNSSGDVTSSGPSSTDSNTENETASTESITTSTGSATTSTTPLEMMTDTSGEDINVPTTLLSSATQMSEIVVPEAFSYDSVSMQNVDIDITRYSTGRGYLSIYSVFSLNSDGTYRADYNSRITSANVENGLASLTYPLADSQYYMLAEIYFYDGTTPIQTRLNNEQSSWIW